MANCQSAIIEYRFLLKMIFRQKSIFNFSRFPSRVTRYTFRFKTKKEPLCFKNSFRTSSRSFLDFN